MATECLQYQTTTVWNATWLKTIHVCSRTEKAKGFDILFPGLMVFNTTAITATYHLKTNKKSWFHLHNKKLLGLGSKEIPLKCTIVSVFDGEKRVPSAWSSPFLLKEKEKKTRRNTKTVASWPFAWYFLLSVLLHGTKVAVIIHISAYVHENHCPPL